MTGEKTKGRKRHIVTDTMGNLLCIRVHAANIHDTKGGIYTFEKALYRYPTIQAGCADGGYRGTFRNTFDEFHNIRIDISMQIKEQKGFQVLTSACFCNFTGILVIVIIPCSCGKSNWICGFFECGGLISHFSKVNLQSKVFPTLSLTLRLWIWYNVINNV